MRIALYHTELSRDGPGLMLAAITDGDPQVQAVVRVIDAAAADVLVLAGLDHDAGGVALAALNARLADPYPYAVALRPNAGVQTGRDLDGDGEIGPRDAQGWGRFPGQGGMAVLSRHPLGPVQDLTGTLWRDLPGSVPAGTDPPDADLRLASVGVWVVPVDLGGGAVPVIAFHATPPLFQPQNPARNAAELRFVAQVLGDLPGPAVVAGVANTDPADGRGDRAALAAWLADPRLRDPVPTSARSGADPGQAGDPRADTAAFDGAGGLRLDYVLPSADLRVTDSGVIWPAEGDPFLATVEAASRHRLVWVDLAAD